MKISDFEGISTHIRVSEATRSRLNSLAKTWGKTHDELIQYALDQATFRADLTSYFGHNFALLMRLQSLEIEVTILAQMIHSLAASMDEYQHAKMQDATTILGDALTALATSEPVQKTASSATK